MEIGSHNSWSFKKVKQWWLRPFTWVARCQKHNLQLQYMDGARCFDLRLRYNEEKKIWETAHGLATFVGGEDWKEDLKEMNVFLSNKNPVCCRVLLEDTIFNQSIAQDYAFYDVCKWLEETFPNIKFFGGWPTRRRWRQNIYNFQHKEPTLYDMYSSSCLANAKNKIWPWLYARKHNHENIERGTSLDYLFIDFVNIK